MGTKASNCGRKALRSKSSDNDEGSSSDEDQQVEADASENAHRLAWMKTIWKRNRQKNLREEGLNQFRASQISQLAHHSTGSPTETLLRLHLPLNDKV
jgi:hypothetical protein